MGGVTLTAAYILPLLLIVWLWLGSDAATPLKLVITLLLPLFYLLHWIGIEQTRGWPASTSPPDRFEMIAADVIEPGRHGDREGVIHLLIRHDDSHQPRLYAVPYLSLIHI